MPSYPQGVSVPISGLAPNSPKNRIVALGEAILQLCEWEAVWRRIFRRSQGMRNL